MKGAADMGDTLTAIKNSRDLAQVDKLLQQEGIRRDGNLDYTCGLFDDDWNLVATGSCFHNTIRCLAVSHTRQGEGLLNQIVSHLMDVQAQRGNFRVFLYTKPNSAKFFGDLGFYEIARVDGKLVFMENRRNGFQSFCKALTPKAGNGTTAAIVMNANPFTLGHRYLVEQCAKENDTVHLFVLEEEAGPIPFAVRWKLVSEGVQDLSNVHVHKSGPYMISSATFPSYFLKDSDDVIKTQAVLDASVFAKLAKDLGITRRYVGSEKASHVTSLYNEVLSEQLPKNGIECCILERKQTESRIISASTVRQAIHDGQLEEVRDMLPETTYAYFASPEAEPIRQAIMREENVVHY